MEVRSKLLFGLDEYKNEDSLAIIEFSFLNITVNEEKLLEKFDNDYVNLEKGKNKITIKNYTFYFLEIDGKNNGIFLEKTKNYYEFLKRDLIYKETKKTKNLVISKDGIRAEFIFFME
ncbi:hypothetical protein [Fusobacterium russii]|uniref:hypothetical protein n=1 Tax=Fusobacterium russii TaxID=854 RepID=UPI0003A47F90|nr:hypothetical protein [Fusobacterium russii]